MNQICDFFGNIYKAQHDSISHIRRLCEKVGIKRYANQPEFVRFVENDTECKRYRQMILNELKFNQEEVNNFMRQWTPFADIWELDKEIFLIKYKEINASVSSVELMSNFERYLDIINRVFFREISTTVQFLLIDCTNFRKALYEEIHNWWTLFASISKP